MPQLVAHIAALVAAVSIAVAILAQNGTVDPKELASHDFGSLARAAANAAICPLKLTGQLLSLQWPPTCQPRTRRLETEHVAELSPAQPEMLPPPLPMADAELVFDSEELAAFDGRGSDANPAKLIYLSVGGVVFDVTAGKRFYGPGEHYACFAARPCTRALCSGSLEVADLTDDVEDFSEKQMEEVFSQVEFYTKKYLRVGVLRDRQLFLDLGIK